MNVDTNARAGEREPSPAEYAEAAAWVARLHGPNRSAQVERGLRRWLDADPAHAAAFEASTAGWEVTGRLPRRSFPRLSYWQRRGYRQGFLRSAIAVAGLAALAFGTLIYLQQRQGVITRVGEQRVLVLDDGSRVTLNTDTRVTVDYDKEARVLELKSGEAMFEVARQANWPFIVKAGGREIRALGTSFVVRREAHEVEVTLVEGKIAVSDAPRSDSGGAAGAAAPPLERMLVPGQRLTLAESEPPRIDMPPIDKVTAWRRGQLDFQATPLVDALAEMNRYSTTKLIVEDVQAGSIPITGVFRAGDAASLATAVALAYDLEVVESGDAIRLSRKSSAQ